jgi:hypothetical protein
MKVNSLMSTEHFESSKYVEPSDEDQSLEPSTVRVKSTTGTLAELSKGISVIVAVTLLMMGGTWVYLNRASLSKSATGEISPGYLMTGKTWEEYKKENEFGPFDEALWPEAKDDRERKAHFQKQFESSFPEIQSFDTGLSDLLELDELHVDSLQ